MKGRGGIKVLLKLTYFWTESCRLCCDIERHMFMRMSYDTQLFITTKKDIFRKLSEFKTKITGRIVTNGSKCTGGQRAFGPERQN